MKIENGYFYVSGIYHFKNDKGNAGTLFYPFPTDSIYGKVDSIYIFNLKKNEVIKPLDIKRSHFAFHVEFRDDPEVAIQISYRQKLLESRAEYILKTTASWGKPLEQAHYQLIVPAELKVLKFSIPPMDTTITSGEIIYYWQKYNYMPSDNMIFEFVQ